MAKAKTERALRKAARRARLRMRILTFLKHPFSNYPPINLKITNPKKTDLPTILVVSHEASRTGAPILSLNLARELAGKYNVISFLVRGGELASEFQSSSYAAVEFLGSIRNGKDIASAIKYLAIKHNILFAVVNSLESRAVLQPLARHHIPSITLIHEFASYTPDRSAPATAALWSNQVIYSAPLVLDNSISYCPEIANASPITLPQGQCDPLNTNETEASCALEKARLRKLFRPNGWSDDTVVILGAGSVQIRKGVDYFISCAKRVTDLIPATSCRFIWIGEHYNPDEDFGYSCYLKDQISRSGLESILSIIPATRHIRAAYELANLMLITSRLDPLPNVAVDGICMGLPVLCFDKTTGIANLLKDGGLGEECVASYLDVEDMSKKIIKIIESRSTQKAIRNRSLLLAEKHFDMRRYASTLESIALDTLYKAKIEKDSCEKALSMNLIDYKFAFPEKYFKSNKEELVLEYVRGWVTGINRRRPRPNFDPACYQSLNMARHDHTDPLVHYAESGQPDGPWHMQK